jgi:thioredoxin reductase
MDYDVLIIGGGPAGLAAALTLGRASRAVLLCDSGEYRNAPAAHMQNVLARDGTSPGQLRADGRAELAKYPTVEVRDVAVAAVAAGFSATLDDGASVSAEKLVLATGAADELPEIDGFAERWGRSVIHCPYCHGYEHRGESFGVLGASPHHVFIATLLRASYSEDVVLLTNGAEPPEDVAGLDVHTEPVVRITGSANVEFADGSTLEREALFAGGPWHPRAAFAADLGCETSGTGAVLVDEFSRTSVPGVFAAGDHAHRRTLPGPMPSVPVAMTAGMIAGVCADQTLHAERSGLPSPLPA